MKKLFYLLCFVPFISCNHDKPVEPSPDLEVVAKQQAPFGGGRVDVRLQKVLYNNQLVSEFAYEGNYLSEEKRYATFQQPALWATRTFTREAGLPKSFNMISAYVSPEGGFVAKDFNPSHNITFNPVTSESYRTLTEDYLISSETYYRDFEFDKDGFIMKETQTNKVRKNSFYTFSYLRDSNHNITEVRQTSNDAPGTVSITKYEYDNHPNPFFKLGMDWQDQISVNVFSPNNMIRETRTNEDGKEIVISYTYEYNATGYPKKVTAQVELPATDPYTLDFIY